MVTLGTSVGFQIDTTDNCPCPPRPPFPPCPPQPIRPIVVDDNVPYNPATYADVEDVLRKLHFEMMERVRNDNILSETICAVNNRVTELSGAVFELSGVVANLSSISGGGGGGGQITIDPEISLTSTNPVQNKAIASKIATISSDIISTSSAAANIDLRLVELSGVVSGFKPQIDVDQIISLTSTNPVQNKVIAEEFGKHLATSSIDSALSDTSTNPVQNRIISGIVATLSATDTVLSSAIQTVDEHLTSLNNWCDEEFINDEFTDFVDLPFAAEIRGGYSDDDILLIGSKRDGLHYMLPGDDTPSRCLCPEDQTTFDGYQFRNIIKGNGCYVATNRDGSSRTNVYTSADGITWSKKDHTLKHVDTNGNVEYSDVTHQYFHTVLASEYPELSSTGYCVEVSTDLENWSVLEVAGEKMVSTHDFRSVMCAGNYLYITTIGGSQSSSAWYVVVDLTTNTIKKQGDDIFHGYKPTNGWMRWKDGNKVYWGLSQTGVNYSDRIIMTEDGFDTFSEFVINPNNKLGFEFSGTYQVLIIRSLTKFNDMYFIGTYETASPHILASYDMKNWHVISTPPFGIGADMLCPFQNILYVGYSGDAADAGLMADVKYSYHTDHLLLKGVLNDLENQSKGGLLKDVSQITGGYTDKIVREKVNEIIVALGGELDQIPTEYTDEDIKTKVNEIIVAYS